ncbi:MAG: hypothetical protein ACOY4I_04440 [Bacillota bacterium]
MPRLIPVIILLLAVFIVAGCTNSASRPETTDRAKAETSAVSGAANQPASPMPETPERAASSGAAPPQGSAAVLPAPPQEEKTPAKAPAPPPNTPDSGSAGGEEKAGGKLDNGPVSLKFSELYSGGGARGLVFSDKLKSLAGQQVTMNGFMAPPLKPSLRFFVLTRQPMSICPFCSTDAEWPADIVLVIMPGGNETSPTQLALRVTGVLETGSQTDPETGFVSQVRIRAEKIDHIR